MSEVRFDSNQNGNPNNGCLWFSFEGSLQSTIDGVVKFLSSAKGELAEIAQTVYAEIEGYSEHIWMRVGSRRYYLYRNCSNYRMGCGADDGTETPYEGDKEKLIAFFEEYKNQTLG